MEAVCCVHTAWSHENVLFMHLFTVDILVKNLIVSAKEYRSKTDVTLIEKTSINVTCNYSQAKYNDLKCKTMDLMTCIAWK